MSSEESGTIEVTLKLSPEQYHQLEEFRREIGAPNLTTALYNAVLLLRKLYKYQGANWDFQAVAPNREEVLPFRLPTRELPTGQR